MSSLYPSTLPFYGRALSVLLSAGNSGMIPLWLPGNNWMPGSIWIVFWTQNFSWLILKTTLRDRSYYPHFTGREINAKEVTCLRLSHKRTVLWPASIPVLIVSWLLWDPGHREGFAGTAGSFSGSLLLPQWDFFFLGMLFAFFFFLKIFFFKCIWKAEIWGETERDLY